MSVTYWENSSSVNTVRVYCDQTIRYAQIYIKSTKRTVTVKTDCIYWIDVSKTASKALEIGSEVLLKKVIDIYGNTVYKADGLWVYTNQKGAISYSSSNNVLGTAVQGNPGLNIEIGMSRSEEPEVGPTNYKYNITLGENITRVDFTYLSGSSQYIIHILVNGTSGSWTDGNGVYHTNEIVGKEGTWSSGAVSYGSFVIQGVYTSDAIAPLILVNNETYKTNYWSVTGTKGEVLDLYIMDNPSYIHYFKCLSGITSYDVYKVDLVLDTDTKLFTVSNKVKNSTLYYYYQSVYLTNFIKETDEYIFNVYEDIDGKKYQSTDITSSGYTADRLWITPEKRKRYIQVEGTDPKYTCGIKLGDGISSCDVSLLDDDGSTMSISYTDGYKLKFKTFDVRSYDTISITNIKIDSTSYIHPYTLSFYDSDYSEIPVSTVPLKSGDSANYPFDTDMPYCIISATENLTTVRIETIGIDSCLIYAGGTYVGKLGTATDTGASDTLNVQPGELIEIPPFDMYQRSNISLTLHYDPSKYVIRYYRKDETDPWWTGTFDYLEGAAFNADDDHYKVKIVGTLYSMKEMLLRVNETIARVQISIDGVNYKARTYTMDDTVNRVLSLWVYPDSAVAIINLIYYKVYNGNTSKKVAELPYVVKFWAKDPGVTSGNSYSEVLKFDASAGNAATFTMTDKHLYPEISATIPKFSWYDSDSDDAKIVKGAVVSENLTAARWNKLLFKIWVMHRASQIIFTSYTGSDEVESKKIIYATLFNAVVKAINQLPGSQTKQLPPPNKGTGATVYAEYFQGGLGKVFGRYSIKDSLNAAIDYFNGDT